MNETILQLDFLGVSWTVTPWKLMGYLGVATFAGRWFVQLFASYRAGQPRFPRLFWHMSLVGSLLLLSYFIFSDKRDSVGVLSNLFPCGIALYNLFLDGRHRRQLVPRDARPGLINPVTPAGATPNH